ncbi:hypothetical protein PM082_009477 [Marasmius tenuissimus]|nr:hypothetical protein PM082_009477 [Marasmius tenuissimus]
MRNLKVTSGRYYRPSYSRVITIMVESGFIMLLFYTIFAGLLLNNGTGRYTSGLSVMGVLVPQITTLAPLLIVVRIGLGQSFEREHARIASSEGQVRIPQISNHSSAFRVTEQNDQNSTVDITLTNFRPSNDEESASSHKLSQAGGV